ncbi:MAG: hybrid sensor histidine kinase/response regulator [Chloroflexota bacterium]
MNKKTEILIADDAPANLQILSTMLQEQGYIVRAAINGKLALNSARVAVPDLILLDIDMPDLNGFEVCKQLKVRPSLQDVPVIFISALDELPDKVQAFRVGGVDYITKPFQLEEVLMRVETQLRLRRGMQEIEELREQEQRYFEKISQMKDDVIQHVSHDLRNPLTAVLMGAEMLRIHGRADDEKGIRLLNTIINGAHRMVTLTSDLLDLAKIETGRALSIETVDLNTFLANLVKPMKPLADEKGLDFVCELPGTAHTISIDSCELERAIQNLLSNAVKYTETGSIKLRTSITPASIAIHVEDTGLGIPEKDIPHLFEKFHRVDTPKHSTIEGTGLGLSIVDSIVRQHQGQIKVESELNVGTVFSIILPQSST